MDTNTTYNTTVADADKEILWKKKRRKRPLVTTDDLDLSNERRNLKKKKRYETDRAKNTEKQTR